MQFSQIMVGDFTRLKLLLTFLSHVKEVWAFDATILTAANSVRIAQLGTFFDQNRFNNQICHLRYLSLALTDLSVILATNTFGLNFSNACLDIHEGMKWRLKMLNGQTSQQIEFYLALLAAGGWFRVHGPYGPRTVFFQPNADALNIRGLVGVAVPARH
jgi:hypothetical protein